MSSPFFIKKYGVKVLTSCTLKYPLLLALNNFPDSFAAMLSSLSTFCGWIKWGHNITCHCIYPSLMSPHDSLGYHHKKYLDPSNHSHQMIPIARSKSFPPTFQSLLVRRTFLASMHCSHNLPTHIYFLANYFTPRMVMILAHTDKLCLDTRQTFLSTCVSTTSAILSE